MPGRQMVVWDTWHTERMSSVAHPPVHQLSLTQVLAAFRDTRVKPSDYIAALHARILAYDGESGDEATGGINAIMDLTYDPADAQARQVLLDADAAYAQAHAAGSDGADLPPLLGVPFLVKELHDVAGRSNTHGTRGRAGMVATDDHPIVARLKAAGAVVLGRTTTPEMSCATFTATTEWGVTRNPFNTAKTPGGSSGGSAAAIAAGFAPLATASDIAGSTRVPAAFCGLPGYKTPYGRTPGVHPLNADWYRGDHVLARTVADTALATQIIMGIDAGDNATVAPNPQLPVLQSAPSIEGLRVAVSRDLGAYDIDPSVAAGLDAAADALRAAGAQVTEVSVELSMDTISRASMAHYGHLIAQNMVTSCDGDLSLLEPYGADFVRRTQAVAQTVSVLDSVILEAEVQDRLAQVMEGFDVLLTPTSAVEDLAADDFHLDGLDRPGGRLDFYWQGHMTVPFNIANRRPVIAMPTGLGSNGVPVSVQVVGHPYADASVFPVATVLEEALPAPRPPVFHAEV